MSFEHRQYRVVRWAFVGLAVLTFGGLAVLGSRLAPWLPYSIGRPTDCGCATIAFQVPPTIALTGWFVMAILAWCIVRWSMVFARHIRRWQMTLRNAEHVGRWMKHERTGIKYWQIPTAELQACTVGARWPTIIVSQGLIQKLSGRELEAVLRHELSHAQRHDPVWAALIDATGSMFGWPMWLRQWAAAAYSLRELVADADATMNYHAVGALSGAVLKLSTIRSEVMGVQFSPNADRIEKILNPAWTPHHRIWSRQSVVALSLGLGLLLAGFLGAHHAKASLPPYPTGQCPRPVQAALCQQPVVTPIRLRCTQKQGWQCQIIPNQSRSSNAPLSLR